MLDTERHVFLYCPLQRGACASLGTLADSLHLSASQDSVEEEETLSTTSVRSIGHFLGIFLPYGES